MYQSHTEGLFYGSSFHFAGTCPLPRAVYCMEGIGVFVIYQLCDFTGDYNIRNKPVGNDLPCIHTYIFFPLSFSCFM